MAKPTKISLSRSQDIPFDKLALSNRNVRRVQAGQSIEELAEDIARRTLLQSLSVRPIPGREGFYEVQAGGRRYRALELLVRRKRLAKNTPIPCVIREDGILEEDSLAENVQRLNLHPLDQFRAFQALSDHGLGEEEIAARFFVTPQIVRRRLKLASVSPKLLDVYAAADMTLEQLMSFTISDDHDRQEQVWEAIHRGYNREAYHIRKLLTENTASASDKRARFIGLSAYEAAGGVVLRDLFSQNDQGWLQDVALLERLVAEKLTAEAEAVKAEGWKWVLSSLDFPYGHTSGLRRIAREIEPLTEDEHARRDALREEMEDIEREYHQHDEDLPDEINQRLAEIEASLDAFENRPVRCNPADIARAGAFVSIDGDGRLKIERGFIRPQDDAPVEANSEEISDANDKVEICDVSGSDETRLIGSTAAPSCNGASAEHAEGEEEGLKPLSERLVMELTAHRTLGLRDALAKDPDTAFLAVLHALVLQTFWRYPMASCLEIKAESRSFSVQAPGLKDSASAKNIEDRHAGWEKQLPDKPDALWDALRALDHDSRMALFAHCASLTINAVQELWNRTPGRRRHADQLAQMLAFDMAADGWLPTVDNYLGRVPKARILEAVTEAKGVAGAELIEHLKKSDMAEQAERLLADTGWLPEPLRTPGIETVSPAADVGAPEPESASREASPEELPAFLTAAE